MNSHQTYVFKMQYTRQAARLEERERQLERELEAVRTKRQRVLEALQDLENEPTEH